MKNSEILAEAYASSKSSSDVFKKAHKEDFIAGFNSSKKLYKPKWIKGIPPHNNEVIVKTQISHHGSDLKTEIKQFAFYENDVWKSIEEDNIEDYNFKVIEYVEIP